MSAGISHTLIELVIIVTNIVLTAVLFTFNFYNSKTLKSYYPSTIIMQYTNIALFFLAASSSLVAATPAGRAGAVKRQANPAANDGAKVIIYSILIHCL